MNRLAGFHNFICASLINLIDLSQERLTIKPKYAELKLDENTKAFLYGELCEDLEFTSSIVATHLWSALEFMAVRFLADWLQHHRFHLNGARYEGMYVWLQGKRTSLTGLPEELDFAKWLEISEVVANCHDYRKYRGAERLARIIDVTSIKVPYDEATDLKLCELEQMRHIVVHKQNWGNERLESFIPNYADGLGGWIWPHEELLNRYVEGAVSFANSFLQSLYDCYGEPTLNSDSNKLASNHSSRDDNAF